jgi:hypothetical protein
MLKGLVTLLLVVLSLVSFPLHAKEKSSLKVNIISRNLNNEAGKEVDVAILKEELEKLGHRVRLFDFLKSQHVTSADINIFLAQFQSDLFPKAKLNWLLANPDFCSGSKKEIEAFDLILCKTEEAFKIFQSITENVYYLGFMSLDCYQPSVSKDFSQHIHVAGKSKMKGSKELHKVWKKNSDFPQLIFIQRDSDLKSTSNMTLITKRVPRDSLLEMQNRCGIHVCPSQTEGFGHYIMEAMSAGSVVITTDAPPMNEFIKDKRCLVGYATTDHQYYATTYQVDEKELAQTVKALQQLSYDELQKIGQHNREEYLRRRTEFKHNFESLMQKTVHDLNQ